MNRKCFLLTNGRGGFSSLALNGTAQRGDHALLMAAKRCPNVRRHLVTDVVEVLHFKGEDYELTPECIVSAEFDEVPQWIYKAGPLHVVKTLAMAYGKDEVSLRYLINDEFHEGATLTVTPRLRFTGKNDEFNENQGFFMAGEKESTLRIEGYEDKLFVATTGRISLLDNAKVSTLEFPLDERDGRHPSGKVVSLFTVELGSDEAQEIVFSTEKTDKVQGKTATLRMEHLMRMNRLYAKADAALSDELSRKLIKASDAYVVRRDSTEGMTVVAGYPFFEDWGRDTMIALPGLTLVTGRYDDCKSILKTFGKYEKNGLLPNLFPEGGESLMYNSIDAPLLFINAVYLYEQFSKDEATARELYPRLKSIVSGYRNGTDFHIKMDETDGLIFGGEGSEQLTWMDVCVEGHCPTPRHGKPVEINAYWYNALKIMNLYALRFEETKALQEELSKNFEALAEKVKTSFLDKFWDENAGCLKDVLNGTYEENQLRCNQIWALCLPFGMLDLEKEICIIEKIKKELYTPIGLRTLTMADENFHEIYIGAMKERDLAYHQGTVWGYYLGLFLRAQAKVAASLEGDKKKALMAEIAEEIEAVKPWLDEGCQNQIAEIYDGKTPTESRGCFAQAWSVGEILYGIYEYKQLFC